MKMTDELTDETQEGLVLTPCELGVLLNYMYPPNRDWLAPAGLPEKLERMGLIQFSTQKARWEDTEKAYVWLREALKTPLPVAVWQMAGGKIVAKKEGAC